MRSLPSKLGLGIVLCSATLAVLACGSRSGLLADGPWEPDDEVIDDDDPVRRLDAGVADVSEPLPSLDAAPDVVVDQRDCKDPNETLVYLVSSTYDLYSFDPRTLVARRIGPIVCPASDPFSTPFSMAVDREGVAYVVYNNGELFRVSTLTTACVATDYQAGQRGIDTFGMGFASDQGGPAESLYIASSERNDTSQLGRIGIPDYQLELLGSFSDEVRGAELTGTGDGRLFAFYSKADAFGGDLAGSFIGQVDKTSGAITAESYLPTVNQRVPGNASAWAFAFWGGDFYTFTSVGGGPSVVHRYRPSDGSLESIATVPTPIVGAGVSTCSPVQ